MTSFPNRILLLLAFALAAATAWGQDPPARVGRLAHIENDVQFSVDRNQRSEPASINWPISSGAVIETGQRGRAEISIGSTAYRLNERSRTEFKIIDDLRVDLLVEGGSLAVSILDRDQANDIAVATPEGVVRFATAGRYRIDVYADSTELSVFAGQASFDEYGRVEQVEAGQQLTAWSDGRHSAGSNRDQDSFDLWVAERERAMLAGTARRHVSPRMTGYADLDAYGDWQTAPDYGAVWYPRGVADDWAPYRYGRWVWIAPWGWTWVDTAPWGFAPFHYGRWALIHGRWAWVPGSYVATPVYAPALVAWVGNGGWSVSFGVGSALAVGWFPLGPREVYVPGYRYSSTYLHQINVTHVHKVRLIEHAVREGGKRRFEHQARPQAVTVVQAQRLREGVAITRTDIRTARREELERAPRQVQAPLRDPGERLRSAGRDAATAPRTSLFGGDVARPGGERDEFRRTQPERREAGPEEARTGRRGSESRQPGVDVGRSESGRGGDPRQALPERRDATSSELGRRNFERRPSENEGGRPGAGRGGDFRQSLPERRQSEGGLPAPQPVFREVLRSEPPRAVPEMPRAAPDVPRPTPQPEMRETPREMPRAAPETPRAMPEAPRPAPQPMIREMPREMPRAAPEMPRAMPEAPRPAPQPMIRETPREMPRSEPPRMQASPQPQGGGGGGREQRREERREERGGR